MTHTERRSGPHHSQVRIGRVLNEQQVGGRACRQQRTTDGDGWQRCGGKGADEPVWRSGGWRGGAWAEIVREADFIRVSAPHRVRGKHKSVDQSTSASRTF